ncbi:Histidine kinase 5-like protein 2 [Colletotrichum sojae]|uniref:histidine kinase n=1 Tax=Colletotrichum sojae TaxID=2175907 RepID=A0A8H6ILC7_9PEZI|nr:Histidine kinase 5-like protein 2 [Colletotrichum sojae]
MGGSIQVLSKPGRGTKVTVVLRLQEAAAPSPTGNPNLASFDEFTALPAQLNGLRVHLLGLPKEYSVDGGEQPELLKGTSSEDALVANFCADWLRMQMVEPSVSGQPLADLILTTAASIKDVHRRGSTNENTVFEFVSQPKLTKALLLSLRRWIKLQASGISTPTPSSLATAEPTLDELAPDAGIQLGSEVGYFCKHRSKLPGPAVAEDRTVQRKQHNGTPDQGVAHVESIEGGGSSERTKDDSTTTTLVPSTPLTSQEPEPSGPRFLLVDDNPINVRILMSYIKKLGYRFACATNGLEAFEAFERSAGHSAEEFRVVLMDISMPVMDGFESTRRIRALETDRGLTRCNVFALTGLASAGAQQEAFASGIDLFLTKPVRLKELSKILETKCIL